MELFRVSSKTKPNLAAGALANIIREKRKAEIEVIGAGALNQAIKAVAIARGFLITSGIEIVCIPSFNMMDVDGKEKTSIRLLVEVR